MLIIFFDIHCASVAQGARCRVMHECFSLHLTLLHLRLAGMFWIVIVLRLYNCVEHQCSWRVRIVALLVV